MDDPCIRTAGLGKTYGGRQPVHALKPLDLEIAPGETFGLLGPNGAGKTTLVKLLLGLVRPTSGNATLFGVPISDPAARQPIGYLPEGHLFPPFLTARQALDVFARMAGVPGEKRPKRADSLLGLVRLSAAGDRRVGTFSKGMLQRLGIAQALMNKPRLVILDEPTDGVDPVGRREIRTVLEMLRDDGVTVFLNSHLLSEVERVCTRVAILKDGEMVRVGTVADLTRQGRAWRLVTTPPPASALRAVGDALVVESAEHPDGLVRSLATLPDRVALNALLDRLRADGVEVEAVEPARQTLEELFIDVVNERAVSGQPSAVSGQHVAPPLNPDR